MPLHWKRLMATPRLSSLLLVPDELLTGLAGRTAVALAPLRHRVAGPDLPPRVIYALAEDAAIRGYPILAAQQRSTPHAEGRADYGKVRNEVFLIAHS